MKLLPRETIPRSALDYTSDMADDRKDRYIRYLVDRLNDRELDYDAMHLVLEDVFASQHSLEEKFAVLEERLSDTNSRLSSETRLRKSAEQKAKKLQEQLDAANKKLYGDKQYRVKKCKNKDREEETDLLPW